MTNFLPFRRGIARGTAVLACSALASCGGPRFVYAPPASVASGESATLTGSAFSRRAFNDILTCVTRVDGVTIADAAHNSCKYLAHHRVVMTPGPHTVAISYAGEIGPYTSGSSKTVTVDLAAGQTYTVKGELAGESTVHIWLSDAADKRVADGGSFDVETDWGKLDERIHNRPPDPTNFNSRDMSVALPEMRHLLVSVDFGDRAQSFQKAFVDKAREVAAACGIAVDFELVEHATTLTLDPAKVPSAADLTGKAAALGADGLLRVAVTSWNGQGAFMPARLDEPLTRGRYSLSVTLSQQPFETAVWSGVYDQKIDGRSGGDLLADHMLHRFAAQGAFPRCPPVPAEAG